MTHDMKGVSSEHLLMGLLQDIKEEASAWPPPPTDQMIWRDSAGAILSKAGINVETLWTDAEKQMMTATIPIVKNVSLTQSAMRVIDMMYEEARAMSRGDLTTEFLLLALIRDQKGSAGQTLQRHGLQLEVVRQQIAALYRPDQPPSEEKQTFWNRFFGR